MREGRRLFGRGGRGAKEYLWALRHLHAQVEPGQALGVIGPNGAGKSTLLRVLAGVTAPTEGRFEVQGRVSSLITIGAGFRSELTGRENIYVGGSVLGMTRKDIELHVDDIVDFSGLASSIDRPVKHYSSGMYMRLGFSLAIFAQPDVLLVDEVLSVGDRAFRARTDARLKDMLADGVTLVFVSHAMPVVEHLCPRTLVLSKGEVVFDGPTQEGINHYHTLLTVPDVELGDTEFETDMGVQRLVGGARIDDVRLLGPNGEARTSFPVDEAARLRFEVRFERDIAYPRLGLSVVSGLRVMYVLPFPKLEETMRAGELAEGVVDLDLHLGPGTYQLLIEVRGRDEDFVAARHRSAPFYVSAREDRKGYGAAHLNGRATFERSVEVRGAEA
ncbi:MAG: ATP-binding cassette domain-containing protein [Actinomycetota bacterium]